jgi:hypothetical protein
MLPLRPSVYYIRTCCGVYTWEHLFDAALQLKRRHFFRDSNGMLWVPYNITIHTARILSLVRYPSPSHNLPVEVILHIARCAFSPLK